MYFIPECEDFTSFTKPLPKSIQAFFPNQTDLVIRANKLNRITDFNDGMPHVHIVLGVQQRDKKGSVIENLFSEIKAQFQATFVPGCCGMGLIYKFSGTDTRPELWDELFNKTLWPDVYQLELFRAPEKGETDHGHKGLHTSLCDITTGVAKFTNQYYASTALDLRLWFPKNYKGVRVCTA